MRASLVIGAGYGDEGKGKTVDWLVHRIIQQNGHVPVVVRYNGGTQAAHTVQYEDGSRIVWHNLNSATALGAPTYWGRKFILNPIGIMEEWHDPVKNAYRPVAYAHPECRVSIPVDMLLNQTAETNRTARHGSCGWGIGETVERSLDPDLLIQAADLAKVTEEQIGAITKAYISKRAAKLGVAVADLSMAVDPGVLRKFVQDCWALAGAVVLLNEKEIAAISPELVLEGAQGLGLCQESEHYPHVTRSRTGSKWAVEFLDAAELGGKLTALNVFYVSRMYATRHGAGPLEWEGQPHGCVVDDATNVPNPWQGALRTAPLDRDLLVKRISQDMEWATQFYSRARLHFVLTHVDHATEETRCVSRVQVSVEQGMDVVKSTSFYVTAGARIKLLGRGTNTWGCTIVLSYGPDRESTKVVMEDDRDIMTYAARAVASGQLNLG